MSGPRTLAVLALLLFSCLGTASVAAAQGTSLQQEQITNLFWIITILALVIGLSVGFVLVYTVVKWRIRPGHKAPAQLPTERHKLEAVWTVVPAIVLVSIGILAFQTLVFTDTIPAHPDVVVTVIGHQWYWEFYTNFTANGTSIHTINKLTLFSNQTVEFHILAADVAHSFFIPDLAFHVDAIPGHDNVGWLEPTQPGQYLFECTQFCGVDHYAMYGTLTVLPSP